MARCFLPFMCFNSRALCLSSPFIFDGGGNSIEIDYYLHNGVYDLLCWFQLYVPSSKCVSVARVNMYLAVDVLPILAT